MKKKLGPMGFMFLVGTWAMATAMACLGVNEFVGLFDSMKSADAIFYSYVGFLGGSWAAIGHCWMRWRA